MCVLWSRVEGRVGGEEVGKVVGLDFIGFLGYFKGFFLFREIILYLLSKIL